MGDSAGGGEADPTPAVARSRAAELGAERWLAEVRVEEAARQRAREGHLRTLEAEEATVAGVLADLAARGQPVVLRLRSGSRHQGRLRLIAGDAVVVDTRTERRSVVRLDAVASVRAGRSSSVPGRGGPSTASRFAALVAALSAPGMRVSVGAGSEAIIGQVDVAGSSVLRLRLDNGEVAYVAMAAVDEVTLHPDRD